MTSGLRTCDVENCILVVCVLLTCDSTSCVLVTCDLLTCVVFS